MRYKSNNICALNGYSLPDLLFGLGLTAIFLGISLPNISAQIKNHSLKKEAAILHNTIEKFYLLALRKSDPITIKILSQRYEVRASGTSSIFSRTLPSPLLLQTQAQEIKLYPSGTTTPATIRLSNGSRECKVKVSLRGRISTLC